MMFKPGIKPGNKEAQAKKTWTLVFLVLALVVICAIVGWLSILTVHTINNDADLAADEMLAKVLDEILQTKMNRTSSGQVDWWNDQRAKRAISDEDESIEDCVPVVDDSTSDFSMETSDDIFSIFNIDGFNELKNTELGNQFQEAFNKLTAKLKPKLLKLQETPLNEAEMENINQIRKFEKELNCTSFRIKDKGGNKFKWMGEMQRKLFYKMLLENKDRDIKGLQIKSRYAVGKLRQAAFEFDLTIQASGVAKVVAGAVSISAGMASLGAVILAPFTLGASLAILPIAAGVGIASGVGSAGASMGELLHTINYQQKAQKLQKFAEIEIQDTSMIMSMFIDAENRFQDELKSDEIAKLKEAMSKRLVLDAVKIGISWNDAQKYADIWEKSSNIFLIVFQTSLMNADFNIKLITQATKVAVSSTSLVSQSKFVGRYAVKMGSKLITTVSATAVQSVIGGITGAINIGVGIWDVFLGARVIQGIGNIGDKFRAAALELENKAEEIVEAFEKLTGRALKRGTTSEFLNIVEIHSCSDQSFDELSMKFSTKDTGNTVSTCTTEKLNIKENGWGINIETLGECSNFDIYNFEATVTVFNNDSYYDTCLDYITLATEGKFVPSMVCYKEEIGKKVKIPGGNSAVFTCSRHPTIARIKTHTCSNCDSHPQCGYGPNTNDPIKLQVHFKNDNDNKTIEGGLCETSYLNKKYNEQFGYDSTDIFRIDKFDQCQKKTFDPEKDFDRIDVKVLKDGSDAWCTDSIKIYTPGFFKDYNIYRCDIFNKGKGIITSNLKDYSCPLQKSAGTNTSIERIDFHTCKNDYAGTGADHIYMQLWTKGEDGKWKTCRTNNLNYDNYIKSDKTFSIDGGMFLEDDGGERLGECEAFEIHGQSLSFKIDSPSNNGFCLDSLSFFSKKSQDAKMTTFMKCDYKELWVDGGIMELDGKQKYNIQCIDESKNPIVDVMFKVCEATPNNGNWYDSFISSFAGTDSQISMEIVSGDNKCFVDLDSIRDDFEGGDFNTFRMRNNPCAEIEIVNEKAEMKIYNGGTDSLCLSQVMIRIKTGKLLNCHLNQKWLKAPEKLVKDGKQADIWTDEHKMYIPYLCF